MSPGCRLTSVACQFSVILLMIQGLLKNKNKSPVMIQSFRLRFALRVSSAQRLNNNSQLKGRMKKWSTLERMKNIVLKLEAKIQISVAEASFRELA